MSTEVSDEELKKMVRDMEEEKRLKELSNEQLVKEVLRRDCDLHVEELCARVWPEWDKWR